MNIIDAPGRFVPVSSVFVRPAEGEAGEDGALWRSMTYTGGPHEGSTVVQHIYANPSRGEICFVDVSADGREAELEVVSALRRNPLLIEHFQRKRDTSERVHLAAPRSEAMRVIETVVAMAKAKELQQADPNFVGTKA